MYQVAYPTAAHAFLGQLQEISTFGKPELVRGQQTKELLNQFLVIRDVTHTLMAIPGRHDNPFAKVCETIWALRGCDDIRWLCTYVPRAAEFSDNGRTWRGAYGPRLRRWNSADGTIDQLMAVYNLLTADPQTRRAVISFWDPVMDNQPGKDIPCNNWASLIIRDGQLYMNVAQRSSDLVWGFSGIDTYFWCTLESLLASWLNVAPGPLSYFITSQHLYERHFQLADRLKATQATMYDFAVPTPVFDLPLPEHQDLDDVLDYLMQADDATLLEENLGGNGLMATWATMRALYHVFHAKGLQAALLYLANMPFSDYKLAAAEYMLRGPNQQLLPAEAFGMNALEYNLLMRYCLGWYPTESA